MRLSKRFRIKAPYGHVFVAILVFAAALTVLWAQRRQALRQPVKIDETAIDRIRHDMTRDEVIAVVGIPPGDYRTRETGYLIDGSACDYGAPYETAAEWQTDSLLIVVGFQNGKVVDFFVGQGDPSQTSPQETWWSRFEKTLGIRLFRSSKRADT